MKPICFVAMPFGTKPRPDGGGDIDFDEVYAQVILPAIEDAGLEPLRADDEHIGGIIHKPMFERLILCDYVVADLTAANANVFYELGVRHAVRPFTTVPMFAADTRLPFDLGLVRALPYHLDGMVPADAAADRSALTDLLRSARNDDIDSPVFQLVDGLGAPDIERLRTDAFRERVDYAHSVKRDLKSARLSHAPMQKLTEVRAKLGTIEDVEAGIAVDLLLSYRAIGAFAEMIELADALPSPLSRTPLVREQLGFALNRNGDRDRAEQVLCDLIESRGPSSETYGILGRVHKDRWQDAVRAGRRIEAGGHLKRATETYLKGFESDWRDAYPGINAITLMELCEPPDERRHTIAPVVVYGAKRRLLSGDPDYWDYATVLEAAFLANDQEEAMSALESALAHVRESWEPESTLNNLQMIVDARAKRGEKSAWYEVALSALREATGAE